MTRRSRSLSVALRGPIVVLIAFAAAHRADAQGGNDEPVQRDARIQQWIAELDADDFAARQTASHELLKAGRAAVGPLMITAQGEAPEAAQRAMSLLERMHASDDEPTVSAAKLALEFLADGTNESLADRAQLALGRATPHGRHGMTYRPGMIPPGMMPGMPAPRMAMPAMPPGMPAPLPPPPLPLVAMAVPIAAPPIPAFAPPRPMMMPPGAPAVPTRIDGETLKRLEEINAELRTINKGLREATEGLRAWRKSEK